MKNIIESVNIQTEVTLSSAHFVQTSKTKCHNLHGHNWIIKIDITGAIKSDGMVLDFIEIKKVLEEYDHKFLVPSEKYKLVQKNTMSEIIDIETNEIICIMPTNWIKLVSVPVITAEWMAIFIKQEIKNILEDGLVAITVWESQKSCAIC